MSGWRDVPEGWVEFTEAFIEEVKLGIHAGWRFDNSLGSAALIYWPHGADQPQAWGIRRRRVLGEPLPVIERSAVGGEQTQ